MNKKELKKFIKDRMKNPNFEGCYYHYLGNDLYLVFAKNDNNDLDCKVAYNADDLQCDYDWDWEIPYNEESGDLIGQDWTDILECGYTADELASEVVNCYDYVLGCSWVNPAK